MRAVRWRLISGSDLPLFAGLGLRAGHQLPVAVEGDGARSGAGSTARLQTTRFKAVGPQTDIRSSGRSARRVAALLSRPCRIGFGQRIDVLSAAAPARELSRPSNNAPARGERRRYAHPAMAQGLLAFLWVLFPELPDISLVVSPEPPSWSNRRPRLGTGLRRPRRRSPHGQSHTFDARY